MINKTLLIITNNYPYGFGEPFLENELNVIHSAFKKIYIVIPEFQNIGNISQQYQLPENVEIIKIYNKYNFGSRFFALLRFGPIKFFNQIMTIKEVYGITTDKSIFKIFLAYEAKEIGFRKKLMKELSLRDVYFSDLFIYTYWCNEYTYAVAKIKSKYPKIKTFTRVHGWDLYFERHDPPYLPFRIFIFNTIDKIFTISQHGKNYLLQKIKGIDENKIEISRLGTENTKAISKINDSHKLRILSLSFIFSTKNIELLIKALSVIDDINIEWVHIGDTQGQTEYVAFIKNLANELLLSKPNISFSFEGTKSKSEVFDYFSSGNVDVLINTSHSEGLPVSMMEAMSFGIPVIASNVGGISEIIDNNENGFLMPANPEAKLVAETIKKFHLLSLSEKTQLKINARLKWENYFDASTNYEKLAASILSIGERSFQMCSRCILDTHDYPEIIFDDCGVCDMCHYYDELIELKEKNIFQLKGINKLIENIKTEGKMNKYDCIIGLSGGIDSTYVALLCKEFGLKPLAVHLDNGWNSELAVKNIENIVKKLGIDLYTHVVDWEEFKDIQLSFMKASVTDIELPTDHAITAILYDMANKYNIKYIISGENSTTEGRLPPEWGHFKNDLINIENIHSKFGKISLKTYPRLGYVKQKYYEILRGIKIIPLLDYVEYNKVEVKKRIVNELLWRDYGGKHYESIFTKFYQSYILPLKFDIDKRKSHFSTLICAGQITREYALNEVKNPPYDIDQIQNEKEYVIKKLGLTDNEFEQLMAYPPKRHTDYKSILNVFERIKKMLDFFNIR